MCCWHSEDSLQHILYDSKKFYNVNFSSLLSANVPVKLGFEFITKEIQFNVKLFWDSVVVKRVVFS